MAWNKGLLVSAMTVLLLACGGKGSQSAGAAAPQLNMTLSTTQMAVSAAMSDPAPTASGTITLSRAPTSKLYLWVRSSQQLIGNLAITGNTETTVTFALTFVSPSSLGVGTYHDTLMVGLYYDQEGNQPIGNSPQGVALTYEVLAVSSPGLISLSPASALAGGAGFTITATGTGFNYSSVLQWNGSPRATTYNSADQLSAWIPAEDLSVPQTAAVTVLNDVSQGGISNPLSFEVRAPVFSITSVSPGTATVGGPAFTLRVQGAQFVSSSLVQWNGSSRPTIFVSPSQLTAQISASDISVIGSAAITVINPVDQGGVSNTVFLPITVPEAVCFQINPGHTGTITFSSANLPAAAAWSVTLDGPPSYALIAQGKVFITVPISGGGSELLALNQATGTKVWGPMIIGGIGNAVYDSGRIFMLHTSGGYGSGAMLEAFDANTGTPLWSSNLPGQYALDAAPTALDGIVYATESGVGVTLYAFEESNGALKWSQVLMAGNDCAPAVTPEGVYVTFPQIAADFDPKTGTNIWYDTPGGDGGGGGIPVVANGVLYAPNGFGTYNGQTINAKNGALMGSYIADNPPAIGTDIGCFLQGGTLRGVALPNATILWSFAGDGQLATSPIQVNNFVFVGSSSGRLYGLDATTGQKVWEQNLGAAIPSGAGWGVQIPLSGLSAGNGLLVVPAGNTLNAFALQ